MIVKPNRQERTVLLVVICFAAGFALGTFFMSEQIKEDVRVSEPEKKDEVVAEPAVKVDEEDDTMSYFSKLVDEN